MAVFFENGSCRRKCVSDTAGSRLKRRATVVDNHSYSRAREKKIIHLCGYGVCRSGILLTPPHASRRRAAVGKRYLPTTPLAFPDRMPVAKSWTTKNSRTDYCNQQGLTFLTFSRWLLTSDLKFRREQREPTPSLLPSWIEFPFTFTACGERCAKARTWGPPRAPREQPVLSVNRRQQRTT